MARIADTFLFRAEAARLDWYRIAVHQAPKGRQIDTGAGKAAFDQRALRTRTADIHLTWGCAAGLGVPLGPFTVWTRAKTAPVLEGVEPFTYQAQGGTGLWWGGREAAFVEVTCTVDDPSRAVALFLYRTSSSLHDMVAATAVPAGSGPTVTLRVRTSGAIGAVLVNGSLTGMQIEPLDVVVNADGWKPVELVGLPVDQPWAGTTYDARDQGPLTAPVPPVEAAIDRLLRGGPPVGWWPFTQSGHPAPPWTAPDPKLLVEEVRADLLPQILELYDGGTPEFEQTLITHQHAVAGPQLGGRTSSLDTTVDLGPWPLLMVPALTDPFLNLATGFGSAYVGERLADGQIAVGCSDFLVTADYEALAPPRGGGGEMAAYAPSPEPHAVVPDPTGLLIGRDGLVPPPVRDAPWRESVRAAWDRRPVTAGLGRMTESAVARFLPASGNPAESLLPPRAAGGFRPFAITAEAAAADRVAFVDGAAEIPIGSGGRQVGYAVAVSDIFGVWSAWRDVAYIGDEPGPQPPRIVSLTLETSYAGTTTCPGRLAVELSTEWLERTPTAIEIVALAFPMATPAAPPPAGLAPGNPTPAGCFRRDLALTFSGDQPTGGGCTVRTLGPDGETPMPAGPGQGDGGRRYAVVADVSLDFSTVARWGVQVWTRRTLAVGASPSSWSPDTAHPAIAVAASPVPVVPLPPPAPPGVPLGSTLDAQGCSHVRVHWSVPGGADVRTCVVWEVAETALRQRCALSTPPPPTDLPGLRLAALWAAYDALSPGDRRNAFRRLREVDGATRELDVTLPKGSTDIHLFVVTTQTTSGVESLWPAGPGAAHEHLQAVISPRLRRPAPPLVRSSVAADGTVTIALEAASAVPVSHFRLLRTRSEAAARSSDSMGPPFDQAAVDTMAPTATDALTGQPVYTATWTGVFPSAWDAWLVRAVAVPVDSVPVQGVRGLLSEASDVISLLVPPGPPDLAPLIGEIWGADHRGVVVRSSTTAPPWATSLGTSRVGGQAGAATVPLVGFAIVEETALVTPPAAAATDEVLQRGARSAGRSPLALWFTRPVAADPVAVTLRVADPLGRVVEQTLTVPGWVPPPPIHLTLVDSFAIAGRGVVLRLACDAPITADTPYVMEIRAVKGPRRFPPLGAVLELPHPAPAIVPRPIEEARIVRDDALHDLLLPLHGQSMSAAFPLAEIPSGTPPFSPRAAIQVVRAAAGGSAGQQAYTVLVPLTAPIRVDVAVAAAEGGRVSVVATL